MSRKDLLPAAGPVLTLRQALYRAARDYRGGMGALALAIGLDPEEMAKRLNPTDNRPMRPEIIEEILFVTRDMRILEALGRQAAALCFVPVPVASLRDAMAASSEALERMAKLMRGVGEAVADQRWEDHEIAELRYHAEKVVCQVMGIVAGAEQAKEAHIHGHH